ncbi:3-hydroxy-2-methylbutyryl-CoA dehydrogenase [Moesziomyces antarcticus]|uniref:3-hydroxy-2-methylbutyryl-CoA dehydrogenase n=2 Tax=Pseudozyma antarctica TaxID=84753 RepID=A0A081CDG3_PSEA2|nr:3-hydroxy-2-methylbutyryl-CoA dehydrogenase [Moesziomyces antarcticus]GAK64709.1 3-hydroxy-2-methylbutyryl-CoA dehydrogenase [Moesziomyces antarcticus]SPO45694.1 related to 3-hydroxyacyl-CoA dehydrogenase [Moesziomyces antarcticus]
MQVKGHVYYVTGGASGLGAATAAHLHALGAYVSIMDLQLEQGQKLATDLNARGGGGDKRAAAFEVDVCDEAAVQAAISGSDKLWPNIPVGGCVNCGGVGMAGKIINSEGEPFDLDVFRRTVEINLIGTFNVSRLTAARLVRDLPKPIPKPTEETKDLGVIINTASAAALEGQAGQCPYSASKGGVLSLTLPMARDLAWFGIRVMTLVPTLFETPMMAQLPKRARQAILRTCEFPARFGHPDEFALSVQSVIENPMLNGSYIRLDGASRLGKL